MTTLWEAARGLYSVALVISLILLAWAARPTLRVLRALAEALTLAAHALERAAVSAKMAKQVDEIHAAVCKRDPPPQ